MTPKSKVILKIAITFVILFVILDILMVEFNLREIVFKSSLFSEDYRYLSFLVPIGVSILTSGVGYLIAKKKNRNKIKWTLLCFIFSIWGVAVLLFLPSQLSDNSLKPGR